MTRDTLSAPPSREVLAITGKGGVGKTTFTAILAKILAADGVNLLAVDTDPPVSLTYALGAQPTKTVGDMRSRLIDDPAEGATGGSSVGADIDAVGAISTFAVPEPTTLGILLVGLTALGLVRRRPIR